MSARRLLVLIRGLGYEFERQHAPASAGASAAPGTKVITSLEEFVRYRPFKGER